MPELPEVECIRRALVRPVVGSRMTLLALNRRDVVTGGRTPRALLHRNRVVAISRLGKRLSIVGEDGHAIVVRLGMSGQLLVLDPGSTLPTHSHAVWSFSKVHDASRWLVFRDPRRFGGIETFRSVAMRDKAWSALGPDALTVTRTQMAKALLGRRQPVKAALLDQSCVAGIGNIYADEALFLARIDPRRKCCRLSGDDIALLTSSIHAVLRDSIKHGGSSLRDYVLPSQARGSFVARHRVYGRTGLPCLKCRTRIRSTRLAGRTTCYCPACQA